MLWFASFFTATKIRQHTHKVYETFHLCDNSHEGLPRCDVVTIRIENKLFHCFLYNIALFSLYFKATRNRGPHTQEKVLVRKTGKGFWFHWLDFVSFLFKNLQDPTDIVTHAPNLKEEDNTTCKPSNTYYNRYKAEENSQKSKWFHSHNCKF